MKDLITNNMHVLFSEMHFLILDNAQNFRLALVQVLLYEIRIKSCYIYISNNFSQLLLLMIELLIFTETG